MDHQKSTTTHKKQSLAAQDVTRRQAETPKQPRARSHISPSQGTPSSNTVPSQYNSDPFVLRFGIDSLYLSYKGELSVERENQLSELKELAQSQDHREQDKAQLSIGNHLFEVLDKGQKNFAFIIVDNWFRIALSRRTSKSMPLAYVQISSEVLTFTPIEEITRNLEFILNTLSRKVSKANVSRVDLFTDFTTQQNLDDIDISHWVTRTTLFNKHYIRPHFTGWSIGYKGDISARLYDKTLEIKKSGKEYLIPIWLGAGWDSEQKVWRLEFQYKREILNVLKSAPLNDLLFNQGPLWRFACHDWLRLSLPNKKDSNTSRWPLHPLWESLAAIDWIDNPDKSLKRIKKQRIPCDESLYINGIAGITSFMALRGITDLHEGVKQYIRHAKIFHDARGRFSDETFLSYIHKKVKGKGRHYNTIKNTLRKNRATQKKAAKTYRANKDGE